jgi:hypothetical protein
MASDDVRRMMRPHDTKQLMVSKDTHSTDSVRQNLHNERRACAKWV